jgi:hypothetical protein
MIIVQPPVDSGDSPRELRATIGTKPALPEKVPR